MGSRADSHPARIFASIHLQIRRLPPAAPAVLLFAISLSVGWLSSHGIALQARSAFERENSPSAAVLEALLQQLGHRKLSQPDSWPPGDAPGLWWDPSTSRVWVVEGAQVSCFARAAGSGEHPGPGTPKHLGSGWKAVEALIQVLSGVRETARVRARLPTSPSHPLRWGF